MYVIKSQTAPACYLPKQYESATEAEAALIEAGYKEVKHPSGTVFVKPRSQFGPGRICQVVPA